MMTVELEPQEIDVLIKEYRLTLEPSPEQRFSIAAVDLLDRDKCLDYLDKVSSIFEASTKAATSSLFAKRYSFLTIAASLYAMSAFNKGMDYSIENCHLESIYQGEAWLPKVRLTNKHVTQPDEGRRDEWRDQVIRSIFAENINKAWQSISKSTRISKAILWENTAIYVYWLYENKFGEGAGDEQKSRIQDDFEYLIKDAPAHLFGEAANPLAKFNTPKQATLASAEPLRIRKTCCFYYQASDEPEDYCSTCPKIKHEVVSLS